MAGEIVYLKKSTNPKKKLMAVIMLPDGTRKTVHFGATGYSDYTIHKTQKRMWNYSNRHKARENWAKSGIDTAGFWSKWILWNKPSLEDSIKHTENKFNITIVNQIRK